MFPLLTFNNNELKTNFVSCVPSQLPSSPYPGLVLGELQILYYFIAKYFSVTTEDFLNT